MPSIFFDESQLNGINESEVISFDKQIYDNSLKLY